MIYIIDRNADTAGLRSIPATTNAGIVAERSEGTAYAVKHGTGKTIGLTIDSVSAAPLPVVCRYWLAHRQYRDIEVQLRHVSSILCKEVKYLFWFETGTKP